MCRLHHHPWHLRKKTASLNGLNQYTARIGHRYNCQAILHKEGKRAYSFRSLEDWIAIRQIPAQNRSQWERGGGVFWRAFLNYISRLYFEMRWMEEQLLLQGWRSISLSWPNFVGSHVCESYIYLYSKSGEGYKFFVNSIKHAPNLKLVYALHST